jgi:Skp family chaperone for outer membrane proteins
MIKLLKIKTFQQRSIFTMVFVILTVVFAASTMVFVVATKVFVSLTMVFAILTMVSVVSTMVFVAGTMVFVVFTMVFAASTMVFVVATKVFVSLTMVFAILTMVFVVSTMVFGIEEMFLSLETIFSKLDTAVDVPETIFAGIETSVSTIRSMVFVVEATVCGIKMLFSRSAPSAAQTSAPAVTAPARTAFVSIQQIFNSCDEGKDELARWQQYADKMTAEVQAGQKELDALRAQFEMQSTKLADEPRADLADSIDAKDTSLQRLQQDAQKELERRRQRYQNRIYRKTLPIIARIAKEKGLSTVQFIDETRDAYIDPALVITDEVIKAYNQAYPLVPVTQPPVKK